MNGPTVPHDARLLFPLTSITLKFWPYTQFCGQNNLGQSPPEFESSKNCLWITPGFPFCLLLIELLSSLFNPQFQRIPQIY